MEVVAQSMGFKTHIRNYKVDKWTSLLMNAFAFVGNLCWFMVAYIWTLTMSQMRVEGLSADKISHFSVIMEVHSLFLKSQAHFDTTNIS